MHEKYRDWKWEEPSVSITVFISTKQHIFIVPIKLKQVLAKQKNMTLQKT